MSRGGKKALNVGACALKNTIIPCWLYLAHRECNTSEKWTHEQGHKRSIISKKTKNIVSIC